MQDGLFNYRFGVSEGKDIACVFYQTLWRICKWQEKMDHKGNGERDIQKGKEGRRWHLRCAENIRVGKGYKNLISIVLSSSFKIWRYFQYWYLKRILGPIHRPPVEYQITLKFNLFILRLVVCCTVSSWGQTKQTDDFWMLQKETCISLCAVIFNKAMGFSTHNQTKTACSQPPPTECFNRVSFQLLFLMTEVGVWT